MSITPTDELPHYVLNLRELVTLTQTSHKKLLHDFGSEKLYHLSAGKYAVPFAEIRAYLQAQHTPFDFQVIAHTNLRGGIGKTTSTVSLASRAVQYGFKTCVLDLDPQASASLALGVEASESDALFYDLWQQPEAIPAALKQVDEHLYLLPSSLDNSLLDAALQRPGDQKKAVANACNALKKAGFDLVVIDCPPTLGTAVISSVCAADKLIIPLANDAFSFRGLALTLGEIQAICEAFQIDTPIINSLLVKVDKRESLSKQALATLEDTYKDYQLPFYIRTSTIYSKMLSQGQTIFANNKKDIAHQDYDQYTRHLLNINLG